MLPITPRFYKQKLAKSIGMFLKTAEAIYIKRNTFRKKVIETN